MTSLEKYLYQLRRIEEHREAKAEREIRKTYKELLKELNGYLGNIYATYSEDGVLNYSSLAKAGMDARFLEEVEQRISGISPRVAKQIDDTVTRTYEACYEGMRNAVEKAAGNREQLKAAFSAVSAVTPEVIKAAVNNPVSGLTLKDTLEKHRKDIIYDIKRNIGVGLSNGDRFSTMAKRIAESLDGDYKKSVRIVRTEAHRVRETGFNDAATAINDTLKQGKSGYVMAKTWRTMKDERVRPAKAKGKARIYNHIKMDGVTIPQDELFKLPSGATCKAPSQTGVAGEDINCRCYLSYDLVLASELTGANNTPVKQSKYSGYENIEEYENAKANLEKAVVDLEKSQKETDDLMDKLMDAMGTPKESHINKLFEDSYDKTENLQNLVEAYKITIKEKEPAAIVELEQYINKTHKFTQPASISGMSFEVAEKISNVYSGVFEKFPELKGKLNGFELKKISDMNDYAETVLSSGESAGRIYLNKMYFSNENGLKTITDRYKKEVFLKHHPAGTSGFEAIVLHEIGHAIDAQMGFKGVGSKVQQNNILRKLGIETFNNGQILKEKLSDYATVNSREFMAEGFAEYMQASKPRQIATAVGELYKEKIKALFK